MKVVHPTGWSNVKAMHVEGGGQCCHHMLMLANVLTQRSAEPTLKRRHPLHTHELSHSHSGSDLHSCSKVGCISWRPRLLPQSGCDPRPDSRCHWAPAASITNLAHLSTRDMLLCHQQQLHQSMCGRSMQSKHACSVNSPSALHSLYSDMRYSMLAELGHVLGHISSRRLSSAPKPRVCLELLWHGWWRECLFTERGA
jgi:hypothetical protein